GLSGLKWFAADGPGSAGGFVTKALGQLTRYLTDDATRNRVLDRVAADIGFDTRVVIGHSLGAVVAYEVAHRLRRPLPLLITLGSPLGPDTCIDDWVRPQPAQPPAYVERWINLADRDDLIAAEPRLAQLFAGHTPNTGPELRSGYTLEHGAAPHNPDFYLMRREIGKSIGEAFAA
ncbi:MAG: alpha/beta fold hydrolase, partial [Streptomycetaceae bacterium]|nr:alpha/beta fold hydrolase [Streptomycetaceae bacterium]